MAKKKKKTGSQKQKQGGITRRAGAAPAHQELTNERVHVFVDDQNLFWGIVNQHYGPRFRIDFGRLLMAAAQDRSGKPRFVGSAYIAGVIPDDDSFWRVAENQGFTVRRGYLGANNRSKQDDAYLITDLVSTLYEQPGPSTVVIVAGDADYVPPLQKSLQRGWRNEVAFIDRGVAETLEPVTHEFRTINAPSIEYLPGI